MLQLINRTELVLRHYLGLSQVSPEALYRTLLSILGELATFASDSKRAHFEGITGTATRAPAFAA